MTDELEFECKEINRLLSKIRNFAKEVDTLPDEVAFVTAKSIRGEVGQFLEDMNFINLIDRPFLMYVGYPRYTNTLKDIGISNMELLLLNIKNFCENKSLSLEDTLKLIAKI